MLIIDLQINFFLIYALNRNESYIYFPNYVRDYLNWLGKIQRISI